MLASWMGGEDVEKGAAILREAGIPTFPYPDTAVRLFNAHVALRRRPQGALRDADRRRTTATDDPDRARAARIVDEARRDGRTLLTEVESKELLAAYGIPITETVVAGSPDEAVAAAGRIGYPVVVKLYSHTISHKTDVGGVQLNLKDEAAVRAAPGPRSRPPSPSAAAPSTSRASRSSR